MNYRQGWTRSTTVRRIVPSNRRLSRHFQASTGLTCTSCQPAPCLLEGSSKLYGIDCRQAAAFCGLE